MSSFLMLGKYSSESIKEMNPHRTDKAIGLIRELDGEVLSIYALLGEYDLAMIVDLSDNEKAMKASLGLSLLTGITFKTLPAVNVDDFDKIIGEM
ncbi:MAG: GYD domain-containing protein [Candidatus Omnitrophica bacterium]|nr:GYD domain-containing protein [Candidatus Omnitrophota bacterium]MBU1997493.1 GYD domain-containing protein [Candidatus Omnitrophota bacterium]